MDKLSKEIFAYSLQNALEFGKADASKILPKLFQHGLKKEKIKDTIPLIKEIVKKVNSMNYEEKNKAFGKLKDIVKSRDVEEKGLQELPEINKKKLVFRLAPFPSGALHIGNAKTYILNALYAEKYKGNIILVLDDTIGSAEKPLAKEGYELIEEAFQWLKIRHKKPVVYKSDRLKIYYKYAEELIEKNKAYVCHCSQEEVRKNREKSLECGCRQFPKGIQLARWKEMFHAKAGSAVLRIKTDMMHPNPAFRDRILFKISEREHPRVGKKYKVWPSLEMSWAIDDHLLGITHIIRGNDLTMETEMEKYIWDIFRWKHPVTIHTGLIRLEGLVANISKSKAQKEVLSGKFTGWDDPRTWSIQSLARRGITPQAIKEFVKEIGLNKQDIIVPIESLYAANRRILDKKALRYSFVASPKKINVENTLSLTEYSVPVHPNTPNKTRKVRVSNKIFISCRDFDMFKGKEVRLLHLFNINVEDSTKISSIDNKDIPRINWVSEGVKAKVLMPNSKWISGLAEESVQKLKIGDVIQFERFGFVRFDGNEGDVYKFWFAHK